MRPTPKLANVELGRDVTIFHPDLTNLYGCSIGNGTQIGPFVEIQRNARVGEKCKISSHVFICEGITIEDNVFVGHGVMFTNDRYPRATNDEGNLLSDEDWTLTPTTVKSHASIGSNATILPGADIGAHALIAAGAVVVEPVADYAIVAGNPARVIGDTREVKLKDTRT